MAAVAARLRALPFLTARTTTVALTAAGLGLLTLVSLYLRTRFIGAAFWIDEGLSVGIAQHSLADIPGVLRQDGSPPLYYMTLHVWMNLFGSTEQATQSLSLVFALLSMPAAYWAAGRVWGVRAAWFAAFLAALNPYLTGHGQETRMYALMSLLSIVATGCFLRAYVLRDRRFVPVFGLALAAMLYTHNWALFFAAAGVGIVVALIWRETEERRGLIRDGLIGFGIAGLAYVPWLPTLAYQSQHTAAPWSNEPGTYEPTRQLSRVLGGYGPAMVLAFGAGLGIAAVWQRRDAIRERKLIAACAALGRGHRAAGLARVAGHARLDQPLLRRRHRAGDPAGRRRCAPCHARRRHRRDDPARAVLVPAALVRQLEGLRAQRHDQRRHAAGAR